MNLITFNLAQWSLDQLKLCCFEISSIRLISELYYMKLISSQYTKYRVQVSNYLHLFGKHDDRSLIWYVDVKDNQITFITLIHGIISLVFFRITNIPQHQFCIHESLPFYSLSLQGITERLIFLYQFNECTHSLKLLSQVKQRHQESEETVDMISCAIFFKYMLWNLIITLFNNRVFVQLH